MWELFDHFQHSPELTALHDTLRQATAEAAELARVGLAAQAAGVLEHRLPDAENQCGPCSTETLALRAEIAVHLAGANRHRDAADGVGRLVADAESVYGPIHYATLELRRRQAHYLSGGGDKSGASTAVEQLLPLLRQRFSTVNQAATWRPHWADFSQVPPVPDLPDREGPHALVPEADVEAEWADPLGLTAVELGASGTYDGLPDDHFLAQGYVPISVAEGLSADAPSQLYARIDLIGQLNNAGAIDGAIDALADLIPELDWQRYTSDAFADINAVKKNVMSKLDTATLPDPYDTYPAALAERMVHEIPRLTGTHGGGNPALVAERIDLIAALGRHQRSATAQGVFEGLVPDLAQVYGRSHPITLTARHEHARGLYLCCGADGVAISRAAAALEDVLPDLVVAHGYPAAPVLEVLAQHADLTARDSRWNEAIDAYTALVPDLVQTHGPGDYRTGQAREALAECLHSAGRTGEGINVLLKLLPELQQDIWWYSRTADRLVHFMSQIYGPDHRLVLTTRIDVVRTLRSIGGDRGTKLARRAAHQLRTDLVCALGAEHPLTLEARLLRIQCMDKPKRRASGCVAELKELLPTLCEVNGADHPSVFEAHQTLAEALARAGRIDDAAAEYRQLLADQQRAFGADSAEVIKTLSKLERLRSHRAPG